MMTCSRWLLLFCALPLLAQGQAGTGPNKLANLIPNLFGPQGIVLPNPDHSAHFASEFQSNFLPLNTSLVSQLTSVPIPSPASGFIFSFDKDLGVYTRSGQSCGPVFGERAETIGKNKFYFGISYQRFNFDKIDGVNLKRLPAVFEHDAPADGSPRTGYQRDLITTMNQLDVQLSQSTAYFTYGLNDRLDISVAIPVVSASLGVVSDATIQHIATSTQPDVHYFDAPSGDRSKKTFAAAGTASGLGDVVVRAKYTAFRWKTGAVAVGVDARMPTGDAYNFLGSGAYGFRPFTAISVHMGRLSPHVNVAYQWNSDSALAGDLRLGTKGRLPRQVQLAAGFDYGVTSKFTFAFDYLAQVETGALRVRQSTFTTNSDRGPVAFPQLLYEGATFTQNSAAVGFKINPGADLLVTFNLLFAMDNNGLRDPVVPLIGLSYTF